MLFLLRKIRRKLLSSNKVTTYLLYAIGEVFLVVVGILIAVSVNEARKENENKVLIQNYNLSLIEDLKADTASYRKIKRLSQKYLDNLDSIQQILSKPSSTADDLIHIAINKYKEGVAGYWGFESQTLRSLMNTGNIELYPAHIRNKVSQLLKLNHETMLMSSATLDWMIRAITMHESKFLRGKGGFQLKINKNLINTAWQEIDKREFTSSFLNMLNAKLIVININNRLLDDQIEKTTELIKDLQGVHVTK